MCRKLAEKRILNLQRSKSKSREKNDIERLTNCKINSTKYIDKNKI